MRSTGEGIATAGVAGQARRAASRAMAAGTLSERAFTRGIVAAMGLALLLGGATLTREPLWHDELSTLALADRPLGEFVAQLPNRQNGILFDVVTWAIVHVGGTSSLWLRLPSLLAFVGAVGLCALVGARLAGRYAGLFAALLLAANPFAVYYSQEARPYGLVLLFALLAVWTLMRALERPGVFRFAAYAVSVAALGYSHDFALLAVLAHPLLLAHDRRRSAWGGFIASLCAAGLFFLPAIVSAPSDLGARALSWVPAPGLSTIKDTGAGFTGSPVAAAFAIAVLAAGAVALARRWRNRDPLPFAQELPAFSAAWLLAPFAVLFLFSFDHPVLIPRYVIASVPALCLALTASVWLLPRAFALPAAVLLSAAFFAASVQGDVERTKEDWPAVAAYLHANASLDQPIVVGGDALPNANGLFYYDGPRYGIDRRHLLWTRKEAETRLPDRVILAPNGELPPELRGRVAKSSGVWIVEAGVISAEGRQSIDRFVSSCARHDKRIFTALSLVFASGCP